MYSNEIESAEYHDCNWWNLCEIQEHYFLFSEISFPPYPEFDNIVSMYYTEYMAGSTWRDVHEVYYIPCWERGSGFTDSSCTAILLIIWQFIIIVIIRFTSCCWWSVTRITWGVYHNSCRRKLQHNRKSPYTILLIIVTEKIWPWKRPIDNCNTVLNIDHNLTPRSYLSKWARSAGLGRGWGLKNTNGNKCEWNRQKRIQVICLSPLHNGHHTSLQIENRKKLGQLINFHKKTHKCYQAN